MSDWFTMPTMPIMDTYTTVGSTRRRSSRDMGENGDIMESARPVPTGTEYPSGEVRSSRTKDGSSRRPSRHHSRPRRHRSSRASSDRASRHSSDSSSNTHSSREEATAKPTMPAQENDIYGFFKETKTEMVSQYFIFLSLLYHSSTLTASVVAWGVAVGLALGGRVQ